MRIKPWIKIGEPKLIAERYKRSLLIQKYRNPHNGELVDFSHFQGNEYASIVLGITPEDKVLLVRQYRHAPDIILLELPGGAAKHKSQRPESVALEEFTEETGHQPEEVICLSQGQCWFDPAQCATPFYPFLFKGCKNNGRGLNLDKNEYVELTSLPLKEWVKMCLNGEVYDSKSIAVTMMALKHLNIRLDM